MGGSLSNELESSDDESAVNTKQHDAKNKNDKNRQLIPKQEKKEKKEKKGEKEKKEENEKLIQSQKSSSQSHVQQSPPSPKSPPPSKQNKKKQEIVDVIHDSDDYSPDIVGLDETDDDDNIPNSKYKKIDNDSSKSKKNDNSSSMEVKEEEVANINYIKPSSDEIEQENELYLSHICHRGHYHNSSEWSAQNLLQNNESQYLSNKSYNFTSNYDLNNKQNYDWMIFKINASFLIKLTKITLKYSMKQNNFKFDQYPLQICIQLMSSDNLKDVILSSNRFNNDKWSKPYFISPSILNTTKPSNDNDVHQDIFELSLAEQYIDELRTNHGKDQFIKISLIESHGNMSNDDPKFCLQNLSIFGVPLLDNNNEKINILNTNDKNKNNEKTYKYELKNEPKTKLTPKPGKDHARVFMREHVIFINVGNKTVKVIKNAIIEEYNRLCRHSKNKKIYNDRNIVLIADGYGFINDMMDTTILNKNFKQIGVKNGKNNTGFYITAAFV